jgi:hypothetical protein
MAATAMPFRKGLARVHFYKPKERAMGTVAVVIGEDFDERALALVRRRLSEAGHVLTVLGGEVGQAVRGRHGSGEVIVEAALAEHAPADFDGVIVLATPDAEAAAFLRRAAPVARAAEEGGNGGAAAAPTTGDVGVQLGAVLRRLQGTPQAGPQRGVRGADYGRQTHGGQSYGTDGVGGQPVEDTGTVKDVDDVGGE